VSALFTVNDDPSYLFTYLLHRQTDGVAPQTTDPAQANTACLVLQFYKTNTTASH